MVQSYGQKLDGVPPSWLLTRAYADPLSNTFISIRDVRFPEYHRMRGRFLHKEVLVNLDVADLDLNVRTGPVQFLGGAVVKKTVQ